MKAPAFSARRLLAPLVPLYRLALGFREIRLRAGFEPIRRLRFPVVSIGNLSTGGSGKTPLAIALAKTLQLRGLHVDVLSRGYGRQSQVATRVNSDGTAEEFGDEPLLIARLTGLPVFVAPQRYNAGLLAEAEQSLSSNGSGLAGKGLTPERCIHLLDDGFQHRQLARTVDILLLDRRDWQDGLLPAGNLREPLKAACRASVIAIPANDPELEAELRAWGWQKPIWHLRRTMEIRAVSGPVAAFCGIARPEQFFGGLEGAGLHPVSQVTFSDHHRYTVADLDRLVSTARAAVATTLVTTEKDLVRLGKLASTIPASMPVVTVRLTVEIEDQATAIGWLIDRLA
jgi:tetraacyldisaccharide 4'-kinase